MHISLGTAFPEGWRHWFSPGHPFLIQIGGKKEPEDKDAPPSPGSTQLPTELPHLVVRLRSAVR